MKFLKRIRSWIDVERQFDKKFGVQIEQTFVVPGQGYELSHGLNRNIEGWRVIDKNKTGDIWKVSDDLTTITLACDTSNVTAKFEIF